MASNQKLEIFSEAFIQAVADALFARLQESEKAKPATGKAGLLTIRQAADRMGCSTQTIRRFIHTGKIPRVGTDRFVRVDSRDLERLIDDSKDGAI